MTHCKQRCKNHYREVLVKFISYLFDCLIIMLKTLFGLTDYFIIFHHL